MSIVDDLRKIANDANEEFRSVKNFFIHSKFVWDIFRQAVDKGETFDLDEILSDPSLSERDLVNLSPHYIRQYLASFTFRQFVSTFESFFFSFYLRLHVHNPWPAARIELKLETILKAKDRDQVIEDVLTKRVNELRYERPRDWFVALNKLIALGCPTEDEIDAIAEIKVARDAIEHNAGIANEQYVQKAGKKAKYAVGEPIELDDDYHDESWQLLVKVSNDLITSAMNRLASSPPIDPPD